MTIGKKLIPKKISIDGQSILLDSTKNAFIATLTNVDIESGLITIQTNGGMEYIIHKDVLTYLSPMLNIYFEWEWER
jgi:hypothetical protein